MKLPKSLYLWMPLIAIMVTTPSFGHARFKLNAAFKARDNNAGHKIAPCGNVPRTNQPTILKAGQTVEVEWEETIQHPGHYIISFSPANDEGFEQNVLVPMVVDDQNDPVSAPNYHSFKTTVQIPNVTCDACTLQLIQVMTDRNPPTNYYSCADIQIKAADDPTVIPPVAPTGLKIQVSP